MEKNNRNIAILLGVYNAEKYILEQLNSIMNQSYKDFTLYIRDDASSDSTLSKIIEFAQNYSNIKIINDSLGNLGCNGNYFHLLSLVDSNYYMFCNADDFWADNKIELSMKEMEEAERKHINSPIIVHTDLAVTDENLNILHESLWKFNNLDPKGIDSFNKIGVCNTVAGATMLFNPKVKEITFPVNNFAPFFDHWMSLQTRKHNGIIIPVYRPLVYYRQIGTNLAAINLGEKNTISYKIKNIKEIFKINKKEALMLKRIGWGGYIKYLFYKIKIFALLRFREHKNI